MKIIFLTKCVPPVIEGVGEYTYYLVKGLRKLGVDAVIATSDDQAASESWIKPVIKKWEPVFISEALSNLNADWIVLQYSPPLYGKRGLCKPIIDSMVYLRKKNKCKIAVTFHEINVRADSWKSRFLKWLLDSQAKRLMLHCDAAVGTCSQHSKMLSPMNPAIPVKIIPVGANISLYQSSAAELENLRRKYGIVNKKVLTFFGRLSGFRNFQTALEVLGEARRRAMPVCLMVLGCVRTSNPALFKEFMDRAVNNGLSQYIVETGDLDPVQLSNHLQITDIFLFPQTDGISTRNTTVMTAMAHGLPIICYEPEQGNFDGYQLPYGVLVPKLNEKGFVEAAIQYSAKGSNSGMELLEKQYFADHFSWEQIAAQYRELLKNG